MNREKLEAELANAKQFRASALKYIEIWQADKAKEEKAIQSAKSNAKNLKERIAGKQGAVKKYDAQISRLEATKEIEDRQITSKRCAIPTIVVPYGVNWFGDVFVKGAFSKSVHKVRDGIKWTPTGIAPSDIKGLHIDLETFTKSMVDFEEFLHDSKGLDLDKELASGGRAWGKTWRGIKWLHAHNVADVINPKPNNYDELIKAIKDLEPIEMPRRSYAFAPNLNEKVDPFLEFLHREDCFAVAVVLHSFRPNLVNFRLGKVVVYPLGSPSPAGQDKTVFTVHSRPVDKWLTESVESFMTPNDMKIEPVKEENGVYTVRITHTPSPVLALDREHASLKAEGLAILERIALSHRADIKRVLKMFRAKCFLDICESSKASNKLKAFVGYLRELERELPTKPVITTAVINRRDGETRILVADRSRNKGARFILESLVIRGYFGGAYQVEVTINHKGEIFRCETSIAEFPNLDKYDAKSLMQVTSVRSFVLDYVKDVYIRLDE